MIRIVLVLTSLLLVAGCARERQRGARAERQTQAMTQGMEGPPMGAANEVAQLAVVEKEPYGAILTDQRGRAVYLFEPDRDAQESTCYGECAEAWPPVLTEAMPEAGHQAVREDQLGTIRRADGQLQVTYNGWPLYYYARDRRPGDVTGQDVHDFGGGWYLVSPEGEQIEERAGAR